MNRSTPNLPVRHQLPESTQTHVHWVLKNWKMDNINETIWTLDNKQLRTIISEKKNNWSELYDCHSHCPEFPEGRAGRETRKELGGLLRLKRTGCEFKARVCEQMHRQDTRQAVLTSSAKLREETTSRGRTRTKVPVKQSLFKPGQTVCVPLQPNGKPFNTDSTG